MAAGEFFLSGWREEDRFNLACKDAILNAIEGYECSMHLVEHERIGVGGDCNDYCSLHLGGGQIGDSCEAGEIYLYPVSTCRGNLVCDVSGTCVEACDAWFSDKLGIGGQCEDGFLVIGECAEDLICDTTGTDLCIPLPGEGRTCVYDNCKAGLWCEIIVSTKTCRAKVGDGESCRRDRACWSDSCVGDVCVGGEVPDPWVCEYVGSIITEPLKCTKDADCDDGSVCNGEDTCNNGDCEVGTPPADGTICGDGLVCRGGECTEPVCGNEIVEGTEGCDDGNARGEDGCDSNCDVEDGWLRCRGWMGMHRQPLDLRLGVCGCGQDVRPGGQLHNLGRGGVPGEG
jgi:cysteine-rich repeat protein